MIVIEVMVLCILIIVIVIDTIFYLVINVRDTVMLKVFLQAVVVNS